MRDMHFSYVGALSHEAALELKAFLVKCAEESHKKISASSSEALYALNFDFFEV